MTRRIGTWLGTFLIVGSLVTGDDDLASRLPRIAPSEPGASLRSLRIHPGFDVIPAAAEPLVADPVHACYDADGRLYVVEMRGYPFPEQAPTGKVRLLVDRDGDGKFDQGTDFLAGLNWPTGVLPHEGGVFACAAPDLIYAKDTDGDGVADIRKVVFTGFGTQNVQQLLNGLAWGLDGWIHGAAAGNGGEIRNPDRPAEKPVLLRGRDFRFRPDGSAFEAISGGGQFGHVFDDFGHRFVCNNRWHARQIVIPSRYLERNPMVIVGSVIADIASDGNEAIVHRVSPPEPWRVVRSGQYEAKMKTDVVFARRLPNAERHPAGFFSSASGLTIYRGAAFPEEFRGNVFVCDVAGNLVHRKTLTPSGAIFRADRAEPRTKAEFLASPEIWFRPVNLINTPSGTLLVLDMYRETIEHPLSIPDDIKSHLDLTSGRDRGRLYEITPTGFQREAAARLSDASVETLVGLLGSPHAWRRETAHRLCRERRGETERMAPELTRLAVSAADPRQRLHALWLLENLGQLSVESILTALADKNAGVRENALILAESRLESSQALRDRVLALADDPDPMARYQATLSLSFLPPDDARAVEALSRVALRDLADRWTRVAIALACRGGRAAELLGSLSQHPRPLASEGGRNLLEELAALVGAGKDTERITHVLTRYTQTDTDPGSARAVIVGLGRGMQRSGGTMQSVLRGGAAERLGALIDSAARQARDSRRSPAERLDAIRLLAFGPPELALDTLPSLLGAVEPPDVQIEALRALGSLDAPVVAEVVLEHWRALGPTVRREAAETLLAQPARALKLLDALAAGSLNASDLDPLRRKQLRESSHAEIRERAAKLLGEVVETPRSAVIASFREALALSGDPARGREVYRKNCATCHRAGGDGVEVGPNLSTVAAKPREELLVHVLDPNREVAPAFVNYNVATRDGRILTGIVAEETVTAVTLKRAEGVLEVVPRTRIEAIQATGLSLMPEGLEKTLQRQDLADVLSFVQSLPAPAGPR